MDLLVSTLLLGVAALSAYTALMNIRTVKMMSKVSDTNGYILEYLSFKEHGQEKLAQDALRRIMS